jgi:hypothetical protein
MGSRERTVVAHVIACGSIVPQPEAPRLRDELGAVRVRRFGRDVPSLGATLAHDAAEEHRAAVARDAVVMAGYVAANPIPHSTPC